MMKFAAAALLLCCAWSNSHGSVVLSVVRDHGNIPKRVLKSFSVDPAFSVNCYKDGSYDLNVGGKLWLQSAPIFFQINGARYSTDDATLQLKSTNENRGEDALGSWKSLEYWYSAGNFRVVTAFRQYDSGVKGIVFEQRFPDGSLDTNVGDPDLISSGFPGFLIKKTAVDLGYMAYGYIMVGNMGKKLGRWNSSSFEIKDGRNSGPMALFDQSGNHSLFVSPFDQFMTTSALHNKTHHQYHWGLMGSVRSVPSQFSMKSIVYYGEGVNDAIAGWGDTMRRYYNKLPHYRESDFTNNYLSYWSDNGAYYVNYYVRGGLIQNLTYEKAMLMVKTYADELQLPYRSLQYSVWFKQGKFGGNGLWSANPSLFPDGMRFMFEKTGLPATAHSRYWSPDTPYAKQNGGKYDFFVEKSYALPYDEQFWTDMFAQSQQFGFMTYMQDWLNKQFDEMTATTDNIYVARTWLMQMGEGARKNGLTIQYCMSESRHILQSLEIPVVTQARASNDYQPNDALQWRIGESSMFAHAVGLAPYKDTFWTTTDQPGNYYHGREPYPMLQAVISVLSTGPVGPGDMIGGTNASLLMRCCAADGLILKPSRPAMAIDAQVLQAAFGGKTGVAGELWTTYSDIARWRFGIIFATDMNNTYQIGPKQANFGSEYVTSRVYTSQRAAVPVLFDDQNLVKVTPACSKANLCLYYTTPVLTWRNETVLLMGEMDKYVPISPNRVVAIQWDNTDFTVRLKGAALEPVTFSYVYAHQRYDLLCIMSEEGTAVISVRSAICLGL